MDFLRFIADLAHVPKGWRQWVGSVVTVLAAFAVPVFEQGEIAVVYICLVLVAGAVLTSFWEAKAPTKCGGRRG